MAMTRAQHRAEAEKLLTDIHELNWKHKDNDSDVVMLCLTMMATVAQVHATLSLEGP